MVKKKAQSGYEALVLLLLILVVAGIVIYGFYKGWFGASKKIEPYTGGSALADLSNLCQQTCLGGAQNSVPYCSSDVKIANDLQFSQLNQLKANLATDFNCVDKDGKTEIDITKDTTACNSVTKGIWQSSSSAEVVNYYTQQAKVTCNSLSKAGLINPCSSISC